MRLLADLPTNSRANLPTSLRADLTTSLATFSYSKTVKEITDSIIFGRGQKLFLDNFVLNSHKLTLQNWLRFEVLDKKQTYFPKIPLLHLLIPFDNWNNSALAFEEVASCDCDYFATFGICSHLVASCCWLDSHFKLNSKNLSNLDSNLNSKNQNSNGQKNLLDQIFAAEIDKTQTIWLNNWQYYLLHPISPKNSSWFKKASWLREVADKSEFNQSFGVRIKRDFASFYRDFYKEKILTALSFETILAGGLFWWNFWQSEIDLWSEDLQIKFWSNLWQNRNQTQLKLIWKNISDRLKTLEIHQKNQIFGVLSNKSNNSTQDFRISLELSLDLELLSWLEENLEHFDIETLLKLNPVLIDEFEKINTLIAKKFLDWSNFVQTGDNYEDFARVLKAWQSVADERIWSEIISQITSLHRKKSKLITLIKEFTDKTTLPKPKIQSLSKLGRIFGKN